ncbi:MAG: PhoH family protein [Oscillatoriales cyanobacterium SM2_2_1]|nr:PhoH family protein [Oscillatoriales cyanobacterium SM2_2_1]
MPETRIFALPSPSAAMVLAGTQEANLKLISRSTGTQLVLRGQELHVIGSPQDITSCLELIDLLKPLWIESQTIAAVDIQQAWQLRNSTQEQDWRDRTPISRTRTGVPIQPRTLKQQRYVKSMEECPLVFGIGPAGTGKTYLAAIAAVRALQEHQCERIVLTRPAVEAGEKLGFLPGDLQQKIDPYLRPLYDALYDVIAAEKIPQMIERGVIEIAPLAYMRGRTLNNAFIIVDEAQNTTVAQMKMVLTRLGFRSRMVVTGDVTQIDLPRSQASGLVMAQKLLQGIEGISFTQFTAEDVVRHPLVQRIVHAFDRFEQTGDLE